MPWIGVDLDGTLAHTEGSHGKPEDIGEPIPKMVLRVKHWLNEGKDVRIFTARAYPPGKAAREIQAVEKWCKRVFGEVLPVTCIKDPKMECLYDDRVVQVEMNEGELIG